MDYIDNWLNAFDFSESEKSYLQTITNNKNAKKLKTVPIQLQNEFYTLFNLSDHRYTHNVMFYDGATTIIDWLFKYYVDDNTLILTTSSEHGSVVDNLKKYKNVIRIFQSNNISLNIDFNKIKQYKRVFLYTISLSMGDSLNMGTSTIQSIIAKLKSYNIEVISVFDSVQEMFLVDRDYSLYDFVIGTAHALVGNIDIGILLYRKHMNILDGNYAECDVFNYIKSINMIKRNMAKLLQFNYTMYQHFSKYIQTDRNLQVINNYFPTFFILTDKLNRLHGIQEIDDNSTKPEISTVCFRATDFICEPDVAFNKVKKCEFVLQ